MAKRVDEILSWYGADNPGVLKNIRWMLESGRLAWSQTGGAIGAGFRGVDEFRDSAESRQMVTIRVRAMLHCFKLPNPIEFDGDERKP